MKKKKKRENFNEKKLSIFFFLFNIIFWLNFSPVYRFGVHIFITLIYLLLINLLLSRDFSKKVFIIFITIFIFFNFSKNINRLVKVEEIFVGIQKIDNLYIKKGRYSNEYVEIFYPDIKKNAKNGWQGRLCWDIPFICSWENFTVNEKYNYLFLFKEKNF